MERSGCGLRRTVAMLVLAVSAVVLSAPVSICQPLAADRNYKGPEYSDAIPYYNLANKYLSKGRYQDAAEKYREAILRYDKEPDFFVNLGVACRKMDDYKGAEDAFKRAIALNDKDWMSWSNLGNAYLKQDRLLETIEVFRKALACNPPAAEKEAILRDITDIKKVLKVRGIDVDAPKTRTAASNKAPSPKAPAQKPSPAASKPIKSTSVSKDAAQAADWGY